MKCKYCESESLFIETRGVHKALVCSDCGKWLKNATKEEVFRYSRIEKLEGKKATEVFIDDYWKPTEEYYCSFGTALNNLNKIENKDKIAMRLPKWQDDVRIRVQFPDEHSKMSAPYLYVESRFGCVPWIPTQIELLSKEWLVIFL